MTMRLSDLDPDFKAECLQLLHQQVERPSRPSHWPLPSSSSDPNEFYPSQTPCIFKSGPAWPTGRYVDGKAIEREIRPVVGSHPIGAVWRSLSQSVYAVLDSSNISWLSIDPLAYANFGEDQPFCPLLLSIRVTPGSLSRDIAVSAANDIKDILSTNGFPEIEVAFFEGILTRHAAGPQFSSIFDHPFPELRKPFTSTLGLSIAPLKSPHFEGTAGLYFRMGGDSDTICVLTCAHVACPPTTHNNTTFTKTNTSQARQEFMLLGNKSYTIALHNIKKEIGHFIAEEDRLSRGLKWVGAPVEGESEGRTQLRETYTTLLAHTAPMGYTAKSLLNDLTKYSAPPSRIIGFLRHSDQISVGQAPNNFTDDWALIELDKNSMDWSNFQGNKIYTGGDRDFATTMFPQAADTSSYTRPEYDLLQAFGVVQDPELRNPKHIDPNGDPSLLVVKNGSGTGTTYGEVNGLESITRQSNGIGEMEISYELTVIACRGERYFSGAGDSGAIVLDKNGRIVGMITGGSGSTHRSDVTYVTPYWWLEKQIKAKFPGCALYKVVS